MDKPVEVSDDFSGKDTDAAGGEGGDVKRYSSGWG
jgi:hypothetical protein